MTSFTRAFSAELLKLKRTLGLWLVLVAPAVVTGLYIGISIDRWRDLAGRETAWPPFVNSIAVMWGLLMFPLLLTLETALLANMEHGSRQWKQVFALPLPRWSVYLTKVATAGLLAGLASLCLSGCMALGGVLLRQVRPGAGFEAAIPWADILRIPLLMWLLDLLILSIHAFVSLRWNSFTLASAVGIVAVTCNLLVVESDKWNRLFPWAFPIHVIAEDTSYVPTAFVISLAGALAVTVLACLEISRRDILE